MVTESLDRMLVLVCMCFAAINTKLAACGRVTGCFLCWSWFECALEQSIANWLRTGGVTGWTNWSNSVLWVCCTLRFNVSMACEASTLPSPFCSSPLCGCVRIASLWLQTLLRVVSLWLKPVHIGVQCLPVATHREMLAYIASLWLRTGTYRRTTRSAAAIHTSWTT